MRAYLFFLLSFMATPLLAEICSRVAFINSQEILVDTSSNKKGEGLRFYLDKDETAKKYLDEYQKRNNANGYSIALGTAGSGLMIASLFTNSDSNEKKLFDSTNMLLAGASLLILNFIIDKSIKKSNEKILDKAVNEYNKRNSPKIYFSPFKQNNDMGVSGGIIQEF